MPALETVRCLTVPALGLCRLGSRNSYIRFESLRNSHRIFGLRLRSRVWGCRCSTIADFGISSTSNGRGLPVRPAGTEGDGLEIKTLGCILLLFVVRSWEQDFIYTWHTPSDFVI